MNTPKSFALEIETIVKLRVNRVINKMNLVKREEFEVLKKMVQKLIMENRTLKRLEIGHKKGYKIGHKIGYKIG